MSSHSANSTSTSKKWMSGQKLCVRGAWLQTEGLHVCEVIVYWWETLPNPKLPSRLDVWTLINSWFTTHLPVLFLYSVHHPSTKTCCDFDGTSLSPRLDALKGSVPLTSVYILYRRWCTFDIQSLLKARRIKIILGGQSHKMRRNMIYNCNSAPH